MAFKLKTAAGKIFSAMATTEEVDRILALPMTQLRIELKQAMQDKKFDTAAYENFVERLSKVDNLGSQVDLARKAAKDRGVESEIDIELNTPAKQLLWAAALTVMMNEGKEPVARSALWKQLQGTVGVHNEGISTSRVISSSLQNDDTTFDWGQPGSWFYFDPKKNHINLDLYYTLLMGFEHTRAVTLHEIGHSELSNTYSPQMKAIYERIKPYIDPRTVDGETDGAPKPKKKFKKSEIKQIEMDIAEWQLRFKLWHMTEDNVVNQFSTNMTRVLPQDFGDSLNYVCAILQGFGEIARGDDKTRDVNIGSDKPLPAGATDEERDMVEKARAQRQAQANQKRDERVKFLETPLTDKQVADIKAGNISPEIAEKMFNQIKTTVLLAFYEKNGFFTGRDKEWQRFRIIPEDIRRTVDMSKIPDADGRDAFRYLVDVSVGVRGADPELLDLPMDRRQAQLYVDKQKAFRAAAASMTAAGAAAPAANEPALDDLIELGAHTRGIRNLQPKPSDRMLVHDPYTTLKDSYRATVAATSEQRGLLMEQIWDRFLKPYADVLLKEAEKELDKQLNKQQQQQQQQNQQGQQGQQGQQSGQQSGGQQSGGQQGGQQGNSQGQEGGSSGESSPGSSGSSSGGGGRSYEMEDEDDEGQNGNQQDKSGQGGDKKDAEADKNDDGGAGEDDPEMDMSEETKKRLDDVSETPEEQRAKENAENGKGQGQGKENGKDGEKNDAEGQENGQGEGKGWDQDPNYKNDKPQKVGDMKNKSAVNEDMTEEEKQELKEKAKQMANADPNGMSSNNAGNGMGLDLGALAKGSWVDFNKRVQELAPVINQVAEAYKKIRKEQRRTILQQSRTHDFMAEDGDVQGRLDKDKLLETKFKQASRQKMNIDDFKKMQEDRTGYDESTIEITTLIDGSGSMPAFNLGNGTTAMEVALQTAVINYMACRKAGIDSYIVMWGDAEPRIIATPKSNLKEVGRTLEGLRRGINSGTDAAPSLVKTIDTMSKHVNVNGTISGSSHLLFLSDGDIGDFAKTVEKLGIVSRNAKNLSVDVAVLRQSGDTKQTRMEQAFQTVIDKTGGRIVGVLRGNDAQQVPLDLARLMLKRVRSFRIKAEPDREKRRRLKSLAKKLQD